MAKPPTFTADRLRELLHYDRETGVFTWRADAGRGGRIAAGSIAGGVSGSGGYILIWIDGKKRSAHRLAWLYVTGNWPTKWLDHRNAVRTDNRFSNLREATPAQNNQNIQARRSDCSSGVRGVTWVADRKKWRAVIVVAGRQRHLGHFDSITEATAARAAAKSVAHPFSNPHGEAFGATALM